MLAVSNSGQQCRCPRQQRKYPVCDKARNEVNYAMISLCEPTDQ